MTHNAPIEIVHYRNEHAADFARLNLEWLVSYELLEPADLKQIDAPRAAIIERGGEIFMALRAGVVVGTCAVIPGDSGTVELAKLAVAREAQGQGLGRKLTLAAIEWARSAGARKVVLVSNHKLEAALRLYEQIGFRHAPLPAETGYATVDVYMELDLGAPPLVSFDLPGTLDILARTPAVVATLLRGTSAAWHAINEGDGTWSAFDVVGHLIHAEETDWVPRARIILDAGESRPFEPFDRFAQLDRFPGWPLEKLLDRFAELRQANLDIVRSWRLTGAQLELRGLHPELGSVHLRQLLATWAVHDLNHIAQIARVMAKRYSEEVGPWEAYLSILKR